MRRESTDKEEILEHIESKTITSNFLLKNWVIIIAVISLVFTLGRFSNGSEVLATEVHGLNNKLDEHIKDADLRHTQMQQKNDAKWGDIPEIEQRVDDLEERKAYEEGYKQALKDKNLYKP